MVVSVDESIPPAGVVGRIARAVAGAYQIFFFMSAWRHFSELRVESAVEFPAFWAFVALGIYFLPWALNLGFNTIRTSGRSGWYAVTAFGALIAVAWGYLGHESLWQPVLSSYLIIVAMYAHGHIGISNIIAAIVGLRGCEMRVIPFLINRLKGKETVLALCPGIWTPVDRWEAGMRQKMSRND